jgi:hypothetical protein
MPTFQSMFLRNIGIYLRVYTAPKPRRTSTSSSQRLNIVFLIHLYNPHLFIRKSLLRRLSDKKTVYLIRLVQNEDCHWMKYFNGYENWSCLFSEVSCRLKESYTKRVVTVIQRMMWNVVTFKQVLSHTDAFHIHSLNSVIGHHHLETAFFLCKRNRNEKEKINYKHTHTHAKYSPLAAPFFSLVSI